MRYDDPNVAKSAVAGLVGAVLLFVIVVLLQAMFYRMEGSEIARKTQSEPYEALARLDAEQREQLGSYRIVDPQAGTVRIPVERAMELVVAESAGASTR